MLKRFIIPCIVILSLVLLVAACGDDDDNGDNGNGDGNGNETETLAESTTGLEDCVPNPQAYDAAPDVTIDPNKSYSATIKTNKGDIVLELDPSVTVTTNNFVFLAREGFYDCLTFHRVEPGFVIQGGDPLGNGTGGPGYAIPGEFEGAVFEEGVLGMARGGDPDSAGSQFFIMLGRSAGLDGSYAAFGHVTSGMDVVQSIAIGDEMESITIQES